MKKVRGFRVRLRKLHVLRTLKYRPGTTSTDSGIEARLQNIIEEAYSLIFPSVIFETFRREDEKYDEILESVRIGSDQIARLTKKACSFTLMAATIGSDLEQAVDSLKEKDLTEAFMLDAAGSEAAEQCANFVSRILQDEARKKECSLGDRYSPGYGDWPIAASVNILEYLPVEKIGISLTDSGIMLPRKSITAIQPWIPR